MIQKIIVLFFTIFVLFSNFAQIPHNQPDHPKGNSATMLLALPLYNEACELYANNKISACKNSLYEAFSISYDLTEAQLFLADIYYAENNLDSAFFFYYSGIDFNIEQKPHYYFKLFEVGMKLGLYDKVKHTISHFNKLYSKNPIDLPYEDGYPYFKEDLEFYEASIKLVTDYKSWIATSELMQSIELENNVLFYSSIQNGYPNKKPKGLPNNAKDIFISKDKSIILFTISQNDSTLIFSGKLKKNKVSLIKKLPNSINQSSWQGTTYLCSNNKTIYFSSNLRGNKDIYLTELDFEKNDAIKTIFLDRINTNKDELSPILNEEKNEFYYSSNGYYGFGGFDVYCCYHSEVIDEKNHPFDPQNLGATFNTNFDELAFSNQNNKQVLIRRNSSKEMLLFFKSLQKNTFIYNL